MTYSIADLIAFFAAHSNPSYELGIKLEAGDIIDGYLADDDGDIIDGLGDERDWDDVRRKLAGRGLRMVDLGGQLEIAGN